MTEKRQTSQDYIIRILQHFGTKLRNITNFVMLFQAVMKFLSTVDLSRSKFCSLGNRSFVNQFYLTAHISKKIELKILTPKKFRQRNFFAS
jgi:hypothetical protein